MAKTALFLCTGNYYRSRFAEAWFNHLAGQAGLDWRAESRGLNIGTWQSGWGPVSEFTRDELDSRGVPIDLDRHPVPCELGDLEQADLVVALKEDEHRPLLAAKFDGWADRVEYWHVHDLDLAGPDEALPQIANYVESLVERLGAK